MGDTVQQIYPESQSNVCDVIFIMAMQLTREARLSRDATPASVSRGSIIDSRERIVYVYTYIYRIFESRIN